MKFGLNLFSIHPLISDEEKYLQTSLKLKQMGYDYVQYSGAEYNPKMIKRVVEQTDLPVALTHVPIKLILVQPEKLAEEHLSFGCKNIGLGALVPTKDDNDDCWKRKIDELQVSANKIKNCGCKFFYHHHYFEFYKFSDGQTVFDYIKDNAPDINFTIDSYWAQYSGYDPITFADDINGRVQCGHLKDYGIQRDTNNDEQFKPIFVPVGSGSLDFDKIITKWQDAGMEYFFVEQDNAHIFEHPFEQVKLSIDYLRNLRK